MKFRSIGLLALVLALCFCGTVSADEDVLPNAVIALCQSSYPQYEVAVYDGWGTDERGQFALVLSSGGHNILCIAERGTEDAAYTFTVANDKAVYQGDALPSLLIDTGGDSLFYTYQSESLTTSYGSMKNASGRWSDVSVFYYAKEGTHELDAFTESGYIKFTKSLTDEEGNLISSDHYTPLPLGTLADQFALAVFSIDHYPVYESLSSHLVAPTAMLENAAAFLQPEGFSYVDGCLTPTMFAFMMKEDASGAQRLFVYMNDQNGQLRDAISTPAPQNAHLDTTHAWTDFSIVLYENEQRYSHNLAPRANGTLQLNYVTSSQNFELGPNYIINHSADPAAQIRQYGTHPWAQMSTVDWDTLPLTFDDALAQLDRSNWARVTSVDPNDRLHLRVQPDKSARSMGKYYRGTPVHILKEQGSWAYVDVYGINGWMLKDFLVTGEAMDGVVSAYPSLSILDTLTRGVPTYSSYDGDQIIAKGYPDQSCDVIGIVGDERYHIVIESSDVSGYVLQNTLWPGNG